jgi:predicted anti-sigma-YlaC factor YlaD
MSAERRFRLALGAVGVVILGYGGVRLLQNAHSTTHPVKLAEWLVGALLVHDLLIAPVVLGVGWLVARWLPRPARGLVLAALIMTGLVSSVGIFLVYRQGKTASPTLALLAQNYRAHLVLLYVAVIVGTGAVAAITRLRRRSVRRDRHRKDLSAADQ